LATHPCKIFWLSIVFFIALASGMAKRTEFKNEGEIWTPAGNPSVLARNRAEQLFPAKGGYIGLLAEVKNPSTSVISKGVL